MGVHCSRKSSQDKSGRSGMDHCRCHMHVNLLPPLLTCQRDINVKCSFSKISHQANHSLAACAEMLETLAEDVVYKILDLVDVRTRASVILVSKTCNRVASVNWRVLDLTTQINDNYAITCLENVVAENTQSMTSIAIMVMRICEQSQAFVPGTSVYCRFPAENVINKLHRLLKRTRVSDPKLLGGNLQNKIQAIQALRQALVP